MRSFPRRFAVPRGVVVGSAAGVLVAGLAAVLPFVSVVVFTAADRPASTADVRAPVAVVLGAGLQGDGTPAPFLAQRVSVAADLYRTGRVRALLMSGDNSRVGYDEVTAMSVAAQRLGVPASAIVLDYAGFDTYSSCYRAVHVFGVHRAVVVSQPFHLPRAVWTCRALGVDAVGARTVADGSVTTERAWVREVPAVVKAMLEVGLGRTPTFPGPREHSLDGVTGT